MESTIAEAGFRRRQGRQGHQGHPSAETIAYWIVTALFCLQIGFTAYAQLRLPQVAEAFTHLGFPAYFRWSSRGPSSSAWC